MNKLAQSFGTVNPPASVVQKFGRDVATDNPIGRLVNLSMVLLVTIAGIYAVFNLILAGYDFLGAGDDPKKVAGAWAKIWQTFLGLAVAAGAFVLAALISQLIYGDPSTLLTPTIPTL